MRVLLLAAVALFVGGALALQVEGDDRQPGGSTTVIADGQQAFSFPAANLNDAERTRFAIGNSFFKRNWVAAPASTTARDGLGPLFIARSCGGCHGLDGRGKPPAFKTLGPRDDGPTALLLRLSTGSGANDPVYGNQLQNAAIPGVPAEGRVSLRWTQIDGRFADGTRYRLKQPHWGVSDWAYGPPVDDLRISPRLAPQLIGVGLIEAIPDSEIVANSVAQAAAGGSIRGTPNRIWDAYAEEERIGRFGWKASKASLMHQTAAAFLGDLGITSSLAREENCSATQRACLEAPHGGSPEIDDRTLADVVFYQATLAPPARRKPESLQVRRGQQLFQQAQCAACHRPSYRTGRAPFPSLSSPAVENQTIWPYTDLLLHDMGEALADHRPDGLAGGRQWKTPPLWGIGLLKSVNGHTRLLHDGRADGVMEAVLWHGGEAEVSKQKVLGMTKAEREALVRFVESL